VPGKRRSTRVRKGAPWLKPVLVQGAWAAARKKNSNFEAQFLPLKARRGPKKAVVAVAASILTTAYHMLADGTCYQDLGGDHFVRRDAGIHAARDYVGSSSVNVPTRFHRPFPFSATNADI